MRSVQAQVLLPFLSDHSILLFPEGVLLLLWLWRNDGDDAIQINWKGEGRGD